MLSACWFTILLLLPSTIGSTSPPFSLRMLSSIITRQQGVVSSGASTSTLESGVLAEALHNAITQYPDQAPILTPYLDHVLAVVTPNLTNATADAKLPLDRFSIATALLTRRQSSDLTPTQDSALTALTDSFASQARNPAGGLWYYVYPQWSYLDGIHSILPFMISQPSPNYTDIMLQINLLREHCAHPSGLLVHGYDYSKTAVWADPVTGGSPYVWGRCLGWFMGGLVEGWEILCSDSSPGSSFEGNDRRQTCEVIQVTFRSLIPPLLSFADSATGAWWQLTTFPNREDNFLESSSTVLFIWSMLKAIRLGLLPPPSYDHDQHPPWPSITPDTPHNDPSRPSSPALLDAATAAALKAYHYTTSASVTYSADANNQTIAFNGTVAVNSLNSTANYTYYTTRPIVMNGLLGESAFVLASLEVERLA